MLKSAYTMGIAPKSIFEATQCTAFPKWTDCPGSSKIWGKCKYFEISHNYSRAKMTRDILVHISELAKAIDEKF